MEPTTGNVTIQPTKWGPVAAITGAFSAYIFSQLILIIPISIIAALNPGKDVQTLIDTSAWLGLALTGFASLALIFVLWLFLKIKKASFKDLGFKKITFKDFGWLILGIIIYFVMLVISLYIASLFPAFNSNQVQDIGYKGAMGWQIILAFIGLVIIPPFAEEMLFRGYLYRGLASRWPKILAALFVSIGFGLVHFQWNVGIDVFVLSLVLIFLFEKTKNLWVCIGLHATKNLLAFLAIFVFVSH